MSVQTIRSPGNCSGTWSRLRCTQICSIEASHAYQGHNILTGRLRKVQCTFEFGCTHSYWPLTVVLHIQAKTEKDRAKPRILVFCNKIKTVRLVHDLCTSAGFKCAVLHGERSQAEREVHPFHMHCWNIP